MFGPICAKNKRHTFLSVYLPENQRCGLEQEGQWADACAALGEVVKQLRADMGWVLFERVMPL